MLMHKKAQQGDVRLTLACTMSALALLLSLLLTVAPSLSFASAEVSYPLTYSGRLVNDRGEPLSGPLALQFYFYDGADVNANQLSSTAIPFPSRRKCCHAGALGRADELDGAGGGRVMFLHGFFLFTTFNRSRQARRE